MQRFLKWFKMEINLRGHHLICLHFFRGRGYDENFTKNLSNLLNNIRNKEITITNSADDVCKKCPYLKGKECKYDYNSEKEIREMDKKAIKLLNIKEKTIKWKRIREKLPKVFNEWLAYCKTCDWKGDCKENSKWTKLTSSLK